MSNNNNSVNTIVFIFISGLVVGFIFGAIATYELKKNKENSAEAVTEEATSLENENINTDTKENNNRKEIKVTKKYTQKGVIIKIEDNQIIIKGPAVENGQIAEKEFTILLEDQTIFQKITLDTPKHITEEMKLKDLKIGDEISISSKTENDVQQNIQGIYEFTAGTINYYTNNN